MIPSTVESSREPAWLASLRQAQAARFEQFGLPHARLETWKYTSLRPLEGRDMAPAEPGAVPALSPEDLADFAMPGEGWRAVLVDGWFQPRLSCLDGLPGGVTVTSLQAADEAALTHFRDLLLRDFDAPDESLSALAASAAHDGLLVGVPDNVTLDRPLHVLSLTSAGGDARIINTRHLIRVGCNASVEIIEQFGSLGEAQGLANLVVQMDLARGGRLRHVRVQQCADTQYLVTRQEVQQDHDSRFDYHGLDLGGRLVRHDVNCRLAGAGAHAALSGLYALDGRRHVDNHTRIDHLAPHTTSEEFFKGVVDGRARAVFNGKVVVHAGADGTDAAQTNNNLVLSPHAEVDTKPELEIYADDVKCSHGATVGQLDERQLYYLRTRGIPADEARLLLTYAFCREIIERLGSGSELVEHLTSLVVARLPRQVALEAIES